MRSRSSHCTCMRSSVRSEAAECADEYLMEDGDEEEAARKGTVRKLPLMPLQQRTSERRGKKKGVT